MLDNYSLGHDISLNRISTSVMPEAVQKVKFQKGKVLQACPQNFMMNSYANVLNIVLKIKHYLPCSLYKIKVEERLEDLLQNYVRMHQIMFFSGGKPVSYTEYHLSLANGCCLEFQHSIIDTRTYTDNLYSVCDLLLICCTQISST